MVLVVAYIVAAMLGLWSLAKWAGIVIHLGFLLFMTIFLIGCVAVAAVL